MKKYSLDYTLVSEADSLLCSAQEYSAQGNYIAALMRINVARENLQKFLSRDNMVEDDDAFNGYVLQSELDTEEIRKDAAIAALPKCIETAEFVLKSGQSIGGPLIETVADMCCRYADALVERLKEAEK